MIVRFWGVRGSMPSPGPATARYGGNTACVSIEVGGVVVVVGAGTGIRELGKHLAATDLPVILLLSHIHYDHVLGFPLFAPLFQEGRVVHLASVPTPDGPWTPLKLMDGLHWPVLPSELNADIREVADPRPLLADAGIELTTVRANHPGGSLGFRFQQENKVFVHVSDNELEPPGVPETTIEQMASFCHGATVLSHDSQYLDREMPHREGWGHSLAMTTCRLAVAAQVEHLVLFHHDPDRTDDDLDRIGRMAAEELREHGIHSTVAYEGLSIDLARPFASRSGSRNHDLID